MVCFGTTTTDARLRGETAKRKRRAYIVNIAFEQMTFYLGLLDCVEQLESEAKTALTYSDELGNRAELEDTIRFLEERHMMLESMAGNLNDTYILVAPE